MGATSSRFSLAGTPASSTVTLTALTMLSAMILFAASTASAFPGRHGGAGAASVAGHPGAAGAHGDDRPTIENRLEDLDLDEQTRETVFAILDENRATARTLRADVRTAHEEMAALLDQDSPDEGAVLAQAEIVGARMTALKKQHLSTMLEVRALLTPEQIDELRAGRPGLERPACSKP